MKNDSKEITIENEITIEEVKDQYILNVVKLKSWLEYCLSAAKDGLNPCKLVDYLREMGNELFIEQVGFGVVDVDELGGKDLVIEVIKNCGQKYVGVYE